MGSKYYDKGYDKKLDWIDRAKRATHQKIKLNNQKQTIYPIIWIEITNTLIILISVFVCVYVLVLHCFAIITCFFVQLWM